MSGSECDRTQKQLTPFLDGELAPEAAAVIRGHLAACAGCAREQETLAAVKALYCDLPSLPSEASARDTIVRAARAQEGERAVRAARAREGGRAAQASVAIVPRLRRILGRPVPDLVTAGALAVSLLLALGLREGRQGAREQGIQPALGSVLTLQEYRSQSQGRPIATHGRLSLNAPQ